MRTKELRLYWRALDDLREAVRGHKDEDEIDFHLAEIETILMHTDNELLRRKCVDTLAHFRVPTISIHAG